MSTNLLEPPNHYSPGNNSVRSVGYVPIRVDQLVSSTYNPRTHFDPVALRELADSIVSHGVLQPVLVRPLYGVGETTTYEVVAGERRYRAAKTAGMDVIPCIVRDLSDEDAVLIAVTENLQRKDLTPFEEARGFELMMELPGMTQQLIGLRLGCSQSRVNKILNLRNLPEAVRDMIERSELSPSHGQRLLPYADFPQVCTALGLIAAKEQWPAAHLDGSKMSSNTLHFLNAIKPAPVVELDYKTKFDWQTVCAKNCPFKAYRPGEWESRGVCLKPDHWKHLQTEALDAKQAEQDEVNAKAIAAYEARKNVVALPMIAAITSAPAPVVDQDAWEDLGMVGRAAQALTNAAMLLISQKAVPLPAEPVEMPSVRGMAYDAYRTVRNAPTGCYESCPCRALAKDLDGKVIEICTNRKRYDKFEEDARKNEKQAKRVECEARLAEALLVLNGQFPIAPALFATGNEPYHLRQAAAVAVCSLLLDRGGEISDIIKPALARRGILIDTALFKNDYSVKRREARLCAELSQYSSTTLLALTAEVVLRREAEDAKNYDSGNKGLAEFLTGQRRNSDAS